ncbi:MAG TPA: UDP-N-acetylmuramate--L-alanine ligase [Elusimicrobia bacterium]|nr:UDP-N-acetylmuramate--L-alanine ligase [Elusimicrobiota bacterium]
MFKKIKKIHFVGIGGSGMSAIAEVLLNLGYQISGSDLKETEVTERLKKLGARIFYAHKRENIAGVQVVVVSSAITKDNPEVLSALEQKIPVIPRAEMLAELARLKYTIAIAGTHGKTTTTSLIGTILSEANFDPTLVVGGRLRGLDTGAKLGKGDFLVAEADESDGSFLKISPTITIVTNIDDDHLDHYGTMEKLENTFVQFINKVPFYGWSILCLDDPGIRKILSSLERKFYTYGLENNADFMAKDIIYDNWESKFTVYFQGKKIGQVNLHLPGRHNISNALAAIACAINLEINFPVIKKALAGFKGIERRLQVRGEKNSITVIDDYGHHPSEIKATLSAIKQRWAKNRLIVIFQPHRYTRTKILADEFGQAFTQADIIKLMEIYPAGEKPLPGISAKLIYDSIKKKGMNVNMFSSGEVSKLVKELKPGDIVLTLGAGDVWKLGEELLKIL